MAIILCSFEGCVRAKETKEYCLPHYKQWKRGSTLKPLREFRTLEWKFWDGAVVQDSCWAWVRTKDKDGYGRIYQDGKTVGAHKVSYMLHVGEIPEGMEIDHKCGTNECCNPEHLRLATHKQNMENKGAGTNSTTGVRGVYWSKRQNKYGATITSHGKREHLGFFDVFEDAVRVRKTRELELFTHSPLVLD